MRGDRLFKRSLRLTYGTQVDPGAFAPAKPFSIVHSENEEGVRVRFSGTRTNRGVSDRCRIDIFNLPADLAKSMREDLTDQWDQRRQVQNSTIDPIERGRRLKTIADGYRVNLFVGYGASQVLLFRGDLIEVTLLPSRGTTDTITRIELGDTLLAMRDNYMRPFWGTGATWTNLIEAATAAADIAIDEAAQVAIAGIAPNAVVTKMKHGYTAGGGRVGDTLTEFVDLFGLQWWVRDGVLYMVPQGATLPDFSIVLRQGLDLLDYTAPSDYGDITGRALLNPNIVPGRGLILQDLSGAPIDKFGFRINDVSYQGDTHGNPWYASFGATSVETSLLAPSREFTSAEFTEQDLLDQLERRF